MRVVAEPMTEARTRSVDIEVFVIGDPIPVRHERFFFGDAENQIAGFPFRIPLIPLDGDASRRYRVRVTTEDGSGSFNSASLLSQYQRDALREVTLRLDDLCIGPNEMGTPRYICPDGQTCRAGTCVADEVPLPTPSGWEEVAGARIDTVCFGPDPTVDGVWI